MANITKAVVLDGQIALTVIKSTDIVNQAINFFNLSPVAAAALGRTLTMGSILSTSLKNDEGSLSILIKGDGEIGSITVVAHPNGDVKGCVANPLVESFLNEKGKLDVARAVGKVGKIQVLKDNGEKLPYIGTSDLVSGEIAEDFANYFAKSEQQPCAISLGVLIAPNGACQSAAGLFLQVLPFCSDDAISKAEEALSKCQNISFLMKDISTQQFLENHFGDLGMTLIGESNSFYQCNCSWEKIDKVIVALSKDDVDQLIEERDDIEVKCHFCNKEYKYDKDKAYRVCGFQ